MVGCEECEAGYGAGADFYVEGRVEAGDEELYTCREG